MPRAAASSRASVPFSNEPHGKAIVISLATPRSADGMRSAAATTNSAFGRPPFKPGSSGASRRLGHRGGVGVDADDEGSAFRARPVHDRPTVAGSEVDDDPVGAGDPML